MVNSRQCKARGTATVLRGIFIVGMILISGLSRGQVALKPDMAKLNILVSRSITKAYNANDDSVKKCCEKGVFLTKFRVDSLGQINDLSFSASAPRFIQDAMTNAVKSIELDLSLGPIFKRLKKTFVLPVVYIYQTGCDYQNIKPGAKYYENYMMMEGKSDKLHFNILGMLTMTDGYLSGPDCVLLDGITVSDQ